MDTNMQKALLLAENIRSMIAFMKKCVAHQTSWGLNGDRLYQMQLFLGEYKFQVLADELHRINQFEYDRKYTLYLVGECRKGLLVMNEFFQRNEIELYMLAGRMHTLNRLCDRF